MTEYSVHIVIDVGSNTCKAGFNGENAPRVVMPTVTGKSKNEMMNIIDNDKLYVGKEALNISNYLKLEYPMKNGIITDFDKMEKVWNHLFYNELKTKPEAHNVFLTESLFTSNKDREKIAEIMFEKFSIFNIHMEPQAIMSLYSTPKSSGIIVESGESMTQIVPVFENYMIPQGVRTSYIAGNEMTKMLQENIESELRRYNVGNMSLITKKIKEKILEVKLNDEPIDTKSFELPDGNIVKIGNERIEIPEIMFESTESPSLQQLIYESVNSIDIHLKKDIMGNIILGGGNSMMKNFPERLKQEVKKIFGKDDDSIKINAQQERLYSAWIGASVVCSIGNFQHMWLSKNDFEEVGHNIVHKKYIF
jgi:actin-related protein